jgi:hypothetical protein
LQIAACHHASLQTLNIRKLQMRFLKVVGIQNT